MKLLVCGDFTSKNRGIGAIEKQSALSSSVCDVINDHDAIIVNLESPVVQGNKIGINKIGPHLKTPPLTVAYLKQCGINFVTLANNHFYDYGNAGVQLTMEVLSQNGMRSVGGGRDEFEKSTTLVIDNRICVLNYCESEFSVGHNMGSNKLDVVKAYYDIKKSLQENLFILVIVHGGHEGYQLPSPRMKHLYHFLIDCGADVVINHHQHCYSGYESYHGGKIFYGLGNFFFDANSPKVSKKWCEGYMVGLDIQVGKLRNYRIYPYIQCRDNNIETRLMEGGEIKDFHQQIEELNKIIVNDVKLQDAFDEFSQKVKKLELMNLVPIPSRILQALYKRSLFPSFLSKKRKLQILNMLRCESHRDICIHLLNDDDVKYEK